VMSKRSETEPAQKTESRPWHRRLFARRELPD
jgi:hypothetical protein